MGVVRFSGYSDEEFLIGAQTGLITEITDYINLELAASYSFFTTPGEDINKAQLSLGINFQY